MERARKMALSTKEMAQLVNLLSEDNVQSFNLETLITTCHRYFSKQDNFRVAGALVMLLQMKDLLPSSTQRIAAIFLLHELYRSDSPSANPFALFLVELLQPLVADDRSQQGLPCGHELSTIELWFLSQLLSPSFPRELYRKTPANIANMDPSSLQPPNVSSLVSSLTEAHHDTTPAKSRVGLPCVISDPDPSFTSRVDSSSTGEVAETLLCGSDQLTELPIEPTFIRPLPPLHSCEGEVAWLNPTESQYSIQWDNQMCTESRKMFAKACKEALTPPEQSILTGQFQADPKLVYRVGLTPQKLPQLVEKNPTVAIEALLNLTTSTQIGEYFAALLNMDMSLHSMEVVNRLTTAVDLPPEFLHLYINNCIQRCRDNADKSHQSRLVRLVCVFLQSLIRNKIINVQDEFVEIQSFCLEFSKIREATALYRLLKTLESGGVEGQLK